MRRLTEDEIEKLARWQGWIGVDTQWKQTIGFPPGVAPGKNSRRYVPRYDTGDGYDSLLDTLESKGWLWTIFRDKSASIDKPYVAIVTRADPAECIRKTADTRAAVISAVCLAVIETEGRDG